MALGKIFQFLYGILAYFLFFGTLLYFIGFMNNWIVPRTIDNGTLGSGWLGYAVNFGLLFLFIVQHTIMARPRFKSAWTKILPEAIERSTFVLLASLALLFLCWQWRAYPSVIWKFENESVRFGFHAIALFGYALLIYASFLIDHFELFGLRQVWENLQGIKIHSPDFKTPWLYQQVRNPLMLGFLIGFWSVPTLTVGHLFFNIVMTTYIILAVPFLEERDIARRFGEPYLQYKARTPMLIPNFSHFKKT